MDLSSPGDLINSINVVLPFAQVFNDPFEVGVVIQYTLLMIIFLVFSAIVSSSETAFFSITLNQIHEMEKDGDKLDKAVIDFLNKPRSLLGTILIANNIFNLSIVVVSYNLIQSVLSPEFQTNNVLLAFLVQVVLVTFLIVMFGEVIPKIYASNRNIKVARSTVQMLQFFYLILSPIVKVLIFSTNTIEKKLTGKNRNVTARDIDEAIDIAVEHNKDEFSRDTKILKGIVKFGNISVTEVMRSRMDTIAIEINTPFDKLLEKVRDSGYSRIPVYEGDFDNVEGILYAKDLLAHLEESADYNWHPLIKPALFVPESKKIDDLLEEFQSKRVHMAIVVDEYGGSSGIVTLEDVLEEVIGEIKDEFDDIQEIDYKKIDDYNYIFEGKTAINDICKVMNIPSESFEEIREDSDSLAGLILELKGELPKQGEILEFKNFTFRVIEMNSTRIVRLKVTIQPKK